MSMKLIQHSNTIERRLKSTSSLFSKSEFTSNSINHQTDQCHTCRRPESTDRMKSIEHSSQLIALKREEMKLKSLHRKLEMRIRQFLHRTRKSIATENKLLTLEKHSQKELIQREGKQLLVKSCKGSWENIRQIAEENQQLNKNITSLCTQIKQMEKASKISPANPIKSNEKKQSITHTEDQLYRMNVQLNRICTENTALRMDVQHMLNRRREMIEEYHQLQQTMHDATDESRQLTSQCSESFANRRNLVAQMRAMRDQHDHEEKKLLNDLRELSRLLENDKASKNFLLTKSHPREKQSQLNEFFAGKRSEGTKHAYTAEEFRRLFRFYFNQDFTKERVLNQTVEMFLNEREKSFTLFEYAVELINELNLLHTDLDNKRQRIRTYFSNDNINSSTIKDVFAKLEYSVHEADMNVQSLDIAKKNLRQLLDKAYEIISKFFTDFDCDRHRLFSSHQTINDRNILLYLATIETRLQQLLPSRQIHRKSNEHHSYTDETIITWKMDQPSGSLFERHEQNLADGLHDVASMAPVIPSVDEISADQTVPKDIVNSILNIYNECILHPDSHLKNQDRTRKKTDDLQ